MTPRLDLLSVKFKTWDDARVREVVREAGGTLDFTMPAIRWASVVIDERRASDLFAALLAHPEVEDVCFQSDIKTQSVGTYNATAPGAHVGAQWELQRINAFRAWKYTRGEGVVIAALDSGMEISDAQSAEYAGKAVLRWNAFHDCEFFTGVDGFGESVTNVDVAGETQVYAERHGNAVCNRMVSNGNGHMGVAPGVTQLVSVTPWSSPSISINGADATDATMAAGLLAAHERFGARVINCSVGSINQHGTPPPWSASALVADAMRHLRSAGVVTAWAAMNSGTSSVDGIYGDPGCEAPSLGHLNVGGISYEGDGQPAGYSCCGTIDFVNITAPGNVCVVRQETQYPVEAGIAVPEGWETRTGELSRANATTVQRNFWAFNGTSSAAPTVAGVCALVISANPSLTTDEVSQIVVTQADRSRNPLHLHRFPYNASGQEGAGVVNAARSVLKALTTVPANAGVVYPYANFFGPGVTVDVNPATGEAITHLRGIVDVEIDGFSSNPITSVELWAGTTMLYSGAPRTTRTGLFRASGAAFDGKPVKVVARTATTTSEEEYTDVVGHAHATATLAPVTSSSVPGGQISSGTTITLSASSDNHPVRISYRWGSGAWQTYTAPLEPHSGVLQFYGVDCIGQVEGGVDHAAG